MLNEDDTFNPLCVSLLWAYPEQARPIAELHKALFDDAWSEDSIRGLLSDQGSTAFVATYERADNVIGFILSRIVADEAEILSVGVSKDYQRHGIAERLVEAVGRIMKRVEVKNLYLEVAVDNAAALALYQKTGFAEVGRRKAYYERRNKNKVDALSLARNIQSHNVYACR